MHIAIVGLNYAPEAIGIARYTSGMAEALAARGHRVTAIVGKPYYPQWSVHPGHRKAGWRHSREAGVDVVRCPHYVPAEPTGWRRVAHLASFALSALVPAWRTGAGPRPLRPDVVVCVSPAVFAVGAAWLLARRSGAPLWLHIQDFEVEAAMATGLLAPTGLLTRIAYQLERRLMALADHVSTISPQMRRRLIDTGVPTAGVSELRNWSDGSMRFGATAGNPYRLEWGIGSRHVALYSGNIANKQGIEVIVAAARALAHRDDVVFVICGQGPTRARYEALAAGLGNVQFHDLQPAARMGELLSLAYVHLLPQIAEAADLVLPSKLVNMLASGRPVVATAAPGTGLASEVEGCGLITAPGDAQALAAAVAQLVDNPGLAAQLGAAGQARADERWRMEPIIDRFEAALHTLCGRPAPAPAASPVLPAAARSYA